MNISHLKLAQDLEAMYQNNDPNFAYYMISWGGKSEDYKLLGDALSNAFYLVYEKKTEVVYLKSYSKWADCLEVVPGTKKLNIRYLNGKLQFSDHLKDDILYDMI